MNLIDYLVRKTKIYRDLDREVDMFDRECAMKGQKIRELTEQLRAEKDKVVKLTVELNETERARRSVAGKLGGLTTKNKRLEEEIKELKSSLTEKKKESKKMDKQLDEKDKQLEDAERKIKFLKGNRRAPNLEELKDYELKRKRIIQKNSSK